MKLYYQKSELPDLISLSESTIDEEIRNGTFPKPRQISRGRVGRLQKDLDERFEDERIYAERELPWVVGIEVKRLRRLIGDGMFPTAQQFSDGRRGWIGSELRRWEIARVNGKPWKPPRRSAFRETELYRHFDAAGRLLYVGISLSTKIRLKGHRQKSKWFSQVAIITIERFATRPAAEAAERAAIKTEKPLHNIAHKERAEC